LQQNFIIALELQRRAGTAVNTHAHLPSPLHAESACVAQVPNRAAHRAPQCQRTCRYAFGAAGIDASTVGR
jgi:hypothetical protein